MPDSSENTPWICHICDRKFKGGESTACSVCYKTTCSSHLKHVAIFNRESGLYEMRPVCLYCAATGGA